VGAKLSSQERGAGGRAKVGGGGKNCSAQRKKRLKTGVNGSRNGIERKKKKIRFGILSLRMNST